MTPLAQILRDGIEAQGCEIDTHSEDGYAITGVLGFEELARYLRDHNIYLHNVEVSA